MKSTFKTWALAALFSLTLPAHAATVIEFESAPTSFLGGLMTSYSESGFTLNVTEPAAVSPSWISDRFIATTALNVNAVFTLTQDNNQGFNFNSIDLFDLAGAVTFSANNGALDTVFSFEPSHPYTFDTSFNNVTSVSWTAHGVLSDGYAFDSINVSPVPEPSTIALMLGGLGLVGFMAARRQKA